jgi:integrase
MRTAAALPVAVLSRYRAWCLAQGHQKLTVDKSERMLRFFQRRWELPLEGLTEDRVIEFLAARREEGVHPKTLNGYVRELNLWSRFHRSGWRLPYFRRHAPVLTELLGPDDEVRLRNVRFVDPSVNARNRAMLLLSLDQGPRRDEIRRIRLSDVVDAPGGGKGILIQRGKGDKPRLLYLARETWEAIEAYLRLYRIRSDSQSLFTSRTGPITYGMMGKIAKEIGRAAGIPNFTWHRGRHRVIDAMLDEGVPLVAIQEVAGHARAETTVAYASRRALRTLTEREVRNFQERRLRPVPARSTEREGTEAVANPLGMYSERGGSTGI